MLKRSFYPLLASQTMANAADILYTMALTVLVLKNTSSLLSAVLIPLMRVGSQMVSSFLAPLLTARYQLPFLLLVSQAGQFLLFVALAAYLRLAPEEPALVLVFALVFAMSFLDGWTTPARNALVPRLATGASLVRANSMIVISDRIVQFAGWGLSGVLVSFIGAGSTLLLAACLYAASFAFTTLLRDPLEADGHYLLHPRSRVASADNAAKESGMSGPRPALLREGFLYIAASRRLRALAFMDVIDMLGATVWVGAFTLVFVQDVLGQGEEWWGFINASYFAGTVVGGMLVLALVNRLQKRLFACMLAGMAGYALLTVVYALSTLPAAALVVIALTGPAAELAYISRQTLVQQSAGPEQLPKVMSAQNTILNSTGMISLLLLGWVAERIGIVPTYMLTAALTISAVIVGLLARRAFRETDSSPPQTEALPLNGERPPA